MVEAISTKEVEDEFGSILADDRNQRIILSGVFGIGKTTFLRKFFKHHEDLYVAIRIFPVNIL